MTMNGKSGAIYAFLYNLISLFGKENEEGILIDMQVTMMILQDSVVFLQENSVNRILRGLREENVIRIVDNKIFNFECRLFKAICRLKGDLTLFISLIFLLIVP